MKIQLVNNRSLLKKFINFPYEFHQTTPNWIPPLKLDQKNIFNPKKNSVLQHCDYGLFLLYDRSKIVGRIAAYINHVANEYWGKKIGFFGHYECYDNPEMAFKLLSVAEKWLKDRGVNTMRGQWNFGTQDIGFICEGFDLLPTILSSYNPPYYNDHVLNFGMKKAKDLLVYNCDTGKGYEFPERFLRLTDKIANRYSVTVRPANINNLVEDTRIIVKLANESLRDNWGFYPVDESEAEQIELARKVIEGDISVRKLEIIVRERNLSSQKRVKDKAKGEVKSSQDAYVADLETKLRRAFNTQVRIRQRGDGKGKIEIEFYSYEEFERLMELFKVPLG